VRSVAIILFLCIPLAAYVLARSAGCDTLPFFAAAGGTFFATLLATIPLMLVRDGDHSLIAQAGLMSSAMQLLLSMLAAVALLACKLPQASLFWMIGFYWFWLVALACVVIEQMKSAPPSQPVAK
jgi:hypothetical protein